jgi:hypothetical protein
MHGKQEARNIIAGARQRFFCAFLCLSKLEVNFFQCAAVRPYDHTSLVPLHSGQTFVGPSDIGGGASSGSAGELTKLERQNIKAIGATIMINITINGNMSPPLSPRQARLNQSHDFPGVFWALLMSSFI